MKILYITFLYVLFSSCKGNAPKETTKLTPANTDTIVEKPNFFPVTNFILGQIYEIKNGGVNPQKSETINSKSDSSWLKMENLEKDMSEFLTPVIDSNNLISLFKETRFMDNSLNAITLNYEPHQLLPDSVSLQRWDVYIDPVSNDVKRIYLLKKLPGDKISHLTWVTGKRCNMKTISKDKDGKSVVEKDVTINWDF